MIVADAADLTRAQRICARHRSLKLGPATALAPLLALVLFLSAPAEAKKLKKKRPQPKPVPVEKVEIVDTGDPEELREALRAARAKGLAPVVVGPVPLAGPAPLRQAGARAPLAGGTGYRPKDVPVTDPSYDGFPASFHAEPSVAAQGDKVVCVFNDGGNDAASPHPGAGNNSDGYATSTDGGATYKDQGKRSPMTGLSGFNGDNVVAAGPDGDFFYISDGSKGNSFYNAIAVSRSTDGGLSWNAATSPSFGLPHIYPDGFFDKGWIAVDRSSAPSRGNVYAVWSDFSFVARTTALCVARSTDHGATWAAQILDTFPHPVAVAYVQVAPNGRVYVGEQDEGSAVDGAFTGTNYVRASTDGGATWGPLLSSGSYKSAGDPKANAICGDPEFFGGLVRYLNGPIEADSSLRIAVDPSDPSGQTVLVATQAIPNDRPGDESDVFVWRSTDGGRSFGSPVRVNDDTTRSDQFMPDLWVAPDGTVGVMWLDRRNDPKANWRLEAWMALSTDHGRTFGCNFPVSAQAFPPIGRCQMSDYNGVFADERRFTLAWGDGRQVDSQAQTTFAIYGGTVPLKGPGPLLSLAGSGLAEKAINVRVKNDGTEAATDIKASIFIDGNEILAPTFVVPFPDVPACHGEAELSIRVPFAVSTSFVTAHLELTGPLGSVSFPFSFALPSTPLGTILKTDFEGTAADFTPDPGSLWHVTSGCAALDAGHSGASVAYFGIEGGCDYDAPAPVRFYGALTSRPLSLPPGAVLLRFNEWAGRSAFWSSDVMGLQISTDGGQSFESLWGYGRMSRYTPDPARSLTGPSGRPAWHPVAVDLSDYSGRSVVLRFFANVVSKAAGGYAVDDIEVIARSRADDAMLGSCVAPEPVPMSAPQSVTLLASNDGTEALPGDPVPPCAPAATHGTWFRFDPPVSGTYELSACGRGFGVALAAFSGDSCGAASTPLGCVQASPCELPVVPPVLTVAARKGEPLRILVASEPAASAGTFSLGIVPRVTTRLVPIVLDVVSSFGSYTTELALTNRGRTDARLTLTYTASLGTREGSGSVAEALPAGRQLVLPDLLAYLRHKGLAIPASSPSAQQGGTLLVAFDGIGADADVAATARTLSPVAAPAGAASLAYGGLAPLPPGASKMTLFGLRSSDADRSKVAVFSTSDTPVTVRIVAFDGEEGSRSAVVREAETLPPYGWLQIEDVLAAGGFTNGYVTVEKTGGEGTFGTYGVINDNATNDGSFVPPVSPRTVGAVPGGRITVPVLVETGRFQSELVLANRGRAAATFQLSYRESLASNSGGGTFPLSLGAGRQLLLPDAVDYLRRHGVAIGARGAASYAGSLRIDVSGVSPGEAYAGVRVSAPAPLGGAFGLFLPGVFEGDEAAGGAVLYGLRADAANRSNVAVVNAGRDADGPVTLALQAFDGQTGAPGARLDVTLAPGEWTQPPDWFASTGIGNGYVVVSRTSGTAPWIAYGVVNDGGRPGERTDDGAYVGMSRQ